MINISTRRAKQRLLTQVKAVEEVGTIWRQRCQISSSLLWGNESFVATQEGEVGGLESLWTGDHLPGQGSLLNHLHLHCSQPSWASRTSQSICFQFTECQVKRVSNRSTAEANFELECVPTGDSYANYAWEPLGNCWKEHLAQRKLGRRW